MWNYSSIVCKTFNLFSFLFFAGRFFCFFLFTAGRFLGVPVGLDQRSDNPDRDSEIRNLVDNDNMFDVQVLFRLMFLLI